VLASRALGVGKRDTQIIATAAMPLPIRWMLDADLGRDRLAATLRRGGRLLARIERVYARKVLHTREAAPEGAIARELIAGLFLDGRLFPEARAESAARLEAGALWRRLAVSGHQEATLHPWEGPEPTPSLEEWTQARIAILGVDTGDDLELLSAEDFVPPALPEVAQAILQKHYPRDLDIGDARYRVHYDLPKREVVLEKVAGQRKAMPPDAFVPRFSGFRVLVKDRSQVRVLRG